MRNILLREIDFHTTGQFIPQDVYLGPSDGPLYRTGVISETAFLRNAFGTLQTKVLYTDWYGYLYSD